MRHSQVLALFVIIASVCQLAVGFLDIFNKKPAVAAQDATPHAVSKVRGVAPHLSTKYDQEKFVCDGGKVILNPSSINDDYCDCQDGSDEPGTSACSNGVYYCLNS
eukprot:gene26040-31442_t